MVKTKNANVGREGHGEIGGSSRGGKMGKGKQVARSETPLDKFISVQAATNYKDWTEKKRNITPKHRVDLSDMGGMEMLPILFHDISWGSLLIVNELFYPMMLYEFYANLQRGRIQSGGNVVTSRVNGKNIAFDDKLLNSILETPEDGMCFYTKIRNALIQIYTMKRDIQEHLGVVMRAKAKQLKSHKDQIEQEKFQELNFDVQDFMGHYAKVLNKLEIGNLP
ncbi:hypothetical protein M9H77_26904 [Catharanthus roseus]|uniref:Uncharacterized protein n=1 Tax=Catharanthus roseus TaxID=4058 RepID=A0ACC0AF26_CATRO|nr:hypothetical protein M9H77_26904 [Catharanthus roseus]